MIVVLKGWIDQKRNWLIYVGIILMLQFFILVIPIFSMSSLKIPMKVLRYIEQQIRIFFGVEPKRKIRSL